MLMDFGHRFAGGGIGVQLAVPSLWVFRNCERQGNSRLTHRYVSERMKDEPVVVAGHNEVGRAVHCQLKKLVVGTCFPPQRESLVHPAGPGRVTIETVTSCRLGAGDQEQTAETGSTVRLGNLMIALPSIAMATAGEGGGCPKILLRKQELTGLAMQ
jgi:hypothetical protein